MLAAEGRSYQPSGARCADVTSPSASPANYDRLRDQVVEDLKAPDTRHITLGFVSAWAWAVFAGIPGLMMLFEDKAGAGICFLLGALVALPPANDCLKAHWRLALSGWCRSAIVVGLLVVAGSLLSSNSRSGASQEALATLPSPSTPDLNLEAQQLVADYAANEVSADQKYKGKLIEVSGRVDSIGKDLLDHPYIAVGTGEELELSVQCTLREGQENAAAGLSKGQIVELRGQCDGKLMNVQFSDCVVIAEGGS